MPIKISDLQPAKMPEIYDHLLIDPINKQNIHVLIQSILAGEDPTMEETPDQWRQRIEDYAKELERELYR